MPNNVIIYHFLQCHLFNTYVYVIDTFYYYGDDYSKNYLNIVKK